jgi:hypothetical protein
MVAWRKEWAWPGRLLVQKPLLVRVRALPLLGFVVVGLAVTVLHLLRLRLALIVICPWV